MRVWITSSNNCRLFLEYDIHLDDSLIPDEQVRKFRLILIYIYLFLFKKEKITKGNNCLWLEICGYRFTDSDYDEILSVSTKQRIYFTKSYNKLSIIRLVKYEFIKIYL
jgi:hypothetical protein